MSTIEVVTAGGAGSVEPQQDERAIPAARDAVTESVLEAAPEDRNAAESPAYAETDERTKSGGVETQDAGDATVQTETESVDDALRAAKLQLAANPKSAYLASRYLAAIRKAKLEPIEALADATPVYECFRDDVWVASRHGWILFDACKALVADGPIGEAISVLGELVTCTITAGKKAGFLPDQVARLYAELSREVSGDDEDVLANAPALLELGETIFRGPLYELMSDKPERQKKRTLPSARERFLSGLRRSYRAAGDLPGLRRLCEQVVAGERAVRDPVWFGRDLLLAYAADPVVPELSEAARKFVLEHGFNGWLQAALATFYTARGLTEKAREAWTRAVALADSPWVWRDAADWELSHGEIEEAARCLEAGLFHCRRGDEPKTWRLHMQLARLLQSVNEIDDAAIELRLAVLTREQGGWGGSREIDNAIGEADALFLEAFTRLAPCDMKELLGRRRSRYREARFDALCARAKRYEVKGMTPDRRRVFFRPLDAGDTDAMYVVRGREQPPERGEKLLAIAVPSWDKKRQRAGARVAWWTRAPKA